MMGKATVTHISMFLNPCALSPVFFQRSGHVASPRSPGIWIRSFEA